MFHVQGEIVSEHQDGDVRVIDEVRLTSVGYHPGRDCLCQRCGDDCITVTRSEFCGDCEISYARSQPCH